MSKKLDKVNSSQLHSALFLDKNQISFFIISFISLTKSHFRCILKGVEIKFQPKTKTEFNELEIHAKTNYRKIKLTQKSTLRKEL